MDGCSLQAAAAVTLLLVAVTVLTAGGGCRSNIRAIPSPQAFQALVDCSLGASLERGNNAVAHLNCQHLTLLSLLASRKPSNYSHLFSGLWHP